MKAKKPIALLFSLTGLVALVVYTAASYYYDYVQFINRVSQSRVEKLDHVFRFAKGYLDNLKLDDLKDFADDSRKALDVDYYVLLKNDKPLFFYHPSNDPTRVLFRETLDGQIEFRESVVFGTISNGDYRLVMGINRNTNQIIAYSLKENSGRIARDLVVILFLFCLIFMHHFDDIRRMLASLPDPNRRKSLDVAPKSQEAQLLKFGLVGFEKDAQELRSQNQTLLSQITSALRVEILSGKKPPYTFTCTMIRLDMNNYSRTYQSPQRGNLIKVLDEFFLEVIQVLARYHGFVYEFIGDEVIFYFKDEHHENSSHVAISALRDIHIITEKFHERCQKEYDFPFFVKSALAHGELTFIRQVDMYSFTGSILIETVRMLSVIKVKDANSVYFDHKIYEKIKPFVDASFDKTLNLPDIPAPKDLYVLKSLETIEQVLARKTWKDMSNFRSDQDLLKILEMMDTQYEQLSTNDLLEICTVLKMTRVQKTMPEIRHVISRLLDRFINSDSPQGLNQKDSYFLSSFLAALRNLVGSSDFDLSLQTQVRKFLNCGDPRVRANVMELFTEKLRLDMAGGANTLPDPKTNREFGNALIFKARAGINNQIIAQLRRGIKSKEASYRASTIYALGIIAQEFKRQNRIAFETHFDLQRLILMLEKAILDDAEMVRRQALLAIRKIDDSKQVERLVQLYHKSSEQRMRLLFEEYFFTANDGNIVRAA